MAAQPDPTSPALRIDARHPTGSVAVLELVGEVDVATVGELAEALSVELARDVRDVVLDFGGVTFLASAGLATLVEQREVTEARGGRLRLAALPHAARRSLTGAGLGELFSTHDSTDAAVAEFRGA